MRGEKTKRRSLRAKMMGINISITLASFVLCGLLCVVSVSLLVGKYVNHDLDFFLTEISDNLNVKISYMEDVIYEIRDSRELMDYLKHDSGQQAEVLKEIFETVADISRTGNQGEGGIPIVDKAYMFREDESFLSTFYYAMVYSEVAESDEKFQEVYHTFQAGREERVIEDSYCTQTSDAIYLAYALFDDNMEVCGTIVYEVNKAAVAYAMQDVDSYDGAFWALYDEAGSILDRQAEDVAPVLTEYRKKAAQTPSVFMVKEREYRVYSREMCLGWSVVVGIPENQAAFALYDSMKIYLLGIVGVLLVGLCGFVVFTYKMTKPIKEVRDKMKQVQDGDFETKLPDYDNQEFHEISTVFNEMTENMNHLVKQVYEKQISITEMELKFLQTQMNPHFMFNVLNSIALQAKMDGNEDVFKMISSFSRLIQAKIYRNNEDKVQIKQELEYVEYYLFLQNFRYGERLQYKICIEDEEILEMYIPKLCMQMIVENAVVHGIEPNLGAGEVSVCIYKKKKAVFIDIADSGVGFEEDGFIRLPINKTSDDKSHNHVGLNNAHHIIQLMYGKEYGITIYSKHGKGTKVSIHIPFDRGEAR